MSENTLATLGGVLAVVLLVLLCVRTVLRERRVGTGNAKAAASAPRGTPVVALDVAGLVVAAALVAALGGRMAVALLHH